MSHPEQALDPPPYLVPHSQEAIRILYRDADLLVVDKPTLLLSVPGRHPLNRDCLIERLDAHYPGVVAVHRLDLDTSGVMIIPRNRESLSQLAKAFQGRMIEKTYIARVIGSIGNDTGTIDLPLTRDWPNRPRQKVCFETGKPSITHWRVLSRENNTSLLELSPETGRSHQLRIHLNAIGHAILGCDFYAPEAVLARAPRLLLHASRIRFAHPTSGAIITAFSPPKCMNDYG